MTSRNEGVTRASDTGPFKNKGLKVIERGYNNTTPFHRSIGLREK